MPASRWAALALPLILALSGCQGGPESTERPLLDGRHEPDVLVEASTLALPPAFVGNRFVTGWLPFGSSRRLKGVVPESEGSRLEIVNLKERARTLVLRTALDQPEAAEVVVLHGDRELARRPLTRRVRLRLPARLPIGRVPLEVRFSNATGVLVREAHLNPSLAAGEVRFQDGAIVQSPWSAVDFVQEFPPGAVLLGAFQPPRSRGPEQTFSIMIESSSGTVVNAWQWNGAGPEELRIELPADGEGPVKVRLVAGGEGDPARWQNLRLAFEAEEQAPALVPAPPRVVILYVFDALRADFVGHLGGPAEISPTLDRLAAEGVTFADHISNAPNTKPSIKSLFIGRPFLLLGHQRLPDSGPPTLAESFADAGYRTVALSGSPWVGHSFGTHRGFQHRSAKAEYRGKGETGARYNDSAERVHAATLEWIDSLGAEERAFLYMHTMHPHNPYDPPPAFEERYAGGIDSQIDGGTTTLLAIKRGALPTSEADRARLRALYAAGMAYNDAHLASFMEEIEREYEPGEVLIIFTSDHGEELFEHGGVLHGYTLYQEQLQIPLVFWWPGVLEPRRVEVGTDHLDLAATLQSLVGRDVPAEHGLPLWGLMAGADREWPKRVRFAAASSVKGGIFMARSAGKKVIWAPRTGTGWGMGQGGGQTHDAEYFFDLDEDPAESVNRAAVGDLEYEWLRARLAAWMARGKLEEIGADGDEQVDEQTLERLRALGYVD